MMSMTPLYAYITCHLIYHFCFNSIFLVKWYMICVSEMYFRWIDRHTENMYVTDGLLVQSDDTTAIYCNTTSPRARAQ